MKRRIICKLLIEDGLAVKYRRFTESRRIVGDPVSVMRTLEDQTVDEFMICFLGAIDAALVRRMTAGVFCPVSVAGSLRTMDQVDELIHMNGGADKVVVRGDELGRAVAAKYGNQAIIYPVDYRGNVGAVDVPRWAGEVILTSIDRDGTGTGLDLDGLRAVSATTDSPVIVAGGCGKLTHVKEAFAAGASGACVSSMFAFTDKSPIKLRSWLVSEGCNVRA